MQQVQLYSPINDYGSFSNIGRAIGHELNRQRIDATIHPLGLGCVASPLPVLLNSHAPIGIAVGYPTAVSGLLQSHQTKILMTVCETDRVPTEWVNACKDVDFVCVPSDWCIEVFVRSGLPKEKLLKVHHGVIQSEIEYSKNSTVLIRDGIHLLHVSGADSFPQRKGTSALVYAVKCLQDEGVTNVNLHLRVRQQTYEKIRDTLGDPDWLFWVASIHGSLGWWTTMLSMSAVIQPSRAEGFGMVPLEASALGVPTITTPCGGHLEHVYADSGGNITVEMGPSTPMRSQGNDVGYAPTVSVDAVHHAICEFIQKQNSTKQAAQYYAKTRASGWDWSVRLTPLMDLVKAHKQKQPMILGAEEGLRGAQ